MSDMGNELGLLVVALQPTMKCHGTPLELSTTLLWL
jgi:hypothetical protein